MRQAVNVTLSSKNLAFSQLSSSGASANEPHAGWQLSALINATLLAISVLCFQNIVPRHRLGTARSMSNVTLLLPW